MMNYKDFKTISINSHLLKGEEIISYCSEHPEPNVQLIGNFMEGWLSDDETVTVHTSGSTGKPKSISVYKNQMLASAAMSAAFFDFKYGQTALLCLPMSYIAGKMMVVRALFSGLNLLCREPSSQPLQDLHYDGIIDFVPLVPMQLQDTKDTGSVRKILLGGAPLDYRLEFRMQRFKAEIYHGYGMTETLSHIAIRHVNGANASPVYKGLEGISFRQDEFECLMIKVPFIKDMIHTLDVVELTGDNSFIWKGRADNVINSGGLKLHPEIIEQKLSAVIKDRFFVTAIPDKRLGQKLCLIIENKSHNSNYINQLQDVFKVILEKYERPGHILFTPKFSSTTSGKIKREETLAIMGF